jgi:hypothetical protein
MLDVELRPQSTDLALNALCKHEGHELVEAVLDSGAVNSVTNETTLDAEIKPSEMSKAGKKYRGPDGSRIPNFGQQDVQFVTDEGFKCGLTMQVADVERPLIAVSHLSEAGNDVILNKSGGKVVNLKTGKTIAVHRKGNLYVLRMWVKKTPAKGVGEASVFPRQGRS